MEAKTVALVALAGLALGGALLFVLPSPSDEAEVTPDKWRRKYTPSARHTFSVWMGAHGKTSSEGFPPYPTELANLSAEKAYEAIERKAQDWDKPGKHWKGLDEVNFYLIDDQGHIVHNEAIYPPKKNKKKASS